MPLRLNIASCADHKTKGKAKGKGRGKQRMFDDDYDMDFDDDDLAPAKHHSRRRPKGFDELDDPVE